MKKIYNKPFLLLRLAFSVFSGFLFSCASFAQDHHVVMNTASGGSSSYTNISTVPSYNSNGMMTATPCNCWIVRDNSFHVAPLDTGNIASTPPEYRCDDNSTSYDSSIVFPFNFCFYGTNFNRLFINSNGNVSFGNAITNYSAVGFPVGVGNAMIAPFWADVDTRNGASGLIYYKLTPTYVIIQWDSVGYWDTQGDKLNTFQLIISDGIDPIIPPGNNVSFCYKDMQWTTGYSGTNGFGGTPATVGANKGDSVNYFQFGRFDHAGTDFNGAFGAPSGVSHLDNESYYFNTCAISNIAPIISGLSTCTIDTINACVGDTLLASVIFFSGDPPPQIVTGSASAGTLTNYTILSNNPGNVDTLLVQIYPDAGDVGYHTFSFTGTDNGSPVLSTSGDLVIHVMPHFAINAGADQSICPGDSVQLTVTSSATAYSWSPVTGLSDPAISNPYAQPTLLTNYVVTGSQANFCDSKDTVRVTPIGTHANAGPDQVLCNGFTTTLNGCSANGTAYSWSPTTGLGNAALCNSTASPVINATYTLTMIDVAGCSTVDSMRITMVTTLPANAGSDVSVCANDSVQLSASGGTSYLWSPTSGLSNSTIANPKVEPTISLTYTVTVSDLTGCNNTDTVHVTLHSIPTVSAGVDVSVCQGSSTTLNGSGSGTSFSWSPTTYLNNGLIASPVSTPPGPMTYILTVTNANFCSSKDTMNITVNPLPGAIAGINRTICSGFTTTIGAGSVSGNTYSWSPTTGLSSSVISNPVATPGGTTTYTVHETIQVTGCQNSHSVVVTVNQSPTVNATAGSTTICAGQNAALHATGAATFIWNPGSIPGSTVLVTPTNTTTYTVTGTTAALCSDTATITIVVDPCTGIFSPEQANTVVIYPNPFSTSAFIEFSEGLTSNGNQFELFDVLGRNVLEFEILKQKTEISRGDLPAGIYFWKVKRPGGEIFGSGKIVIE